MTVTLGDDYLYFGLLVRVILLYDNDTALIETRRYEYMVVPVASLRPKQPESLP